MSISQLTGTSWHVETLHSDDRERRHKSRCIHYDQNKCPYHSHCIGSAHCAQYSEHHPSSSYTGDRDGAVKKGIASKRTPNIKPSNAVNKTIGNDSKIILFDCSEQCSMIVTIVQTESSQSVDNKTLYISNETALAKALLGCSVGDTVSVNQFKYRIEKIFD